MASSTSQFCVICKIDKTGVKVQRLRDGFDNMKRMSLRKGEISLHDELVNMRESNTPIYVHENCRKLLTDKRPRNDSAGGSNSMSKRTRSQSEDNLFDWKKNCFLCSKKIDFKHTGRKPIRYVQTIPVKDSFVTQEKQRNDKWGNAVFTRLQGLSVGDLFAAEAVYHVKCSKKFRYIKGSGKRGRPCPKGKQDSFENFCTWFEGSCVKQSYRFYKLYDKIVELGNDIYSRKSFREMFKTRYEKDCNFLPGSGPQSDMVVKVSNFEFNDFKPANKEEAVAMVAKMILQDIKKLNLPSDYASPMEINDENNNWVPDSLQIFMSHLVTSPLKFYQFHVRLE